MRAIYAVSLDGFMARDHHDHMDWTGSLDKGLFRVLTGVGGVVGVGSTTYDLMTRSQSGGRRLFPGRRLVRITRGRPREGEESMSLSQFDSAFRDGWLAGGHELMKSALMNGCIDEMHVCMVPAELGRGLKAPDIPMGMEDQLTTRFHDRDGLYVVVRQYRRAGRHGGA